MRRISLLIVTLTLLTPAYAANAGTPTGSAAPVATVSVSAKFKQISKRAARKRPALRLGSRGAWVKALQRALRARPYDGIFGPKTARAVRNFRRRAGLKPRGMMNPDAWVRLGTRVVPPSSKPKPKPKPAPNTSSYPVLKRGHISSWVQALQSALGIGADGIFGPQTEATVKAFQRSKRIKATGVVNQATWKALGSKFKRPATDVTTTDAAKSSRSHRTKISRSAFVKSWTARMVVHRESRGNCDAVSKSAKYMGKWQMDQTFWKYYGGPAYAPRPDKATCGQQDVIAHRGWIRSWWRPWPTHIP